MLQASKWKLTVVVLSALFGLLFTVPNVLPASVRAGLPGWVPAKTLNLGLDLQGGSSLLLEADVQGLKQERHKNLVEDIRNNLNNLGDKYSGLNVLPDGATVTIDEPEKFDAAYRALGKLAQPGAGGQRDMNISRNGQTIRFTDVPDAQAAIAAKALEQSIEIVRKRIDQMGTKEPGIYRQGSDRIYVEAPGESDPEKLKSIIGKTAKLTFQMVDDSMPVPDALQVGPPPGSELLPYDSAHGSGMELVRKRPVIEGAMLTHTSAGIDQQSGTPNVSMRFNSEGAKRFGRATADNVGKRFAIVLDGKIISAPVIRVPILTGDAEIDHIETNEAATELSNLLNGGALPVKLVTVDQRQVGATLGADAVKAGAISTVVGFIAIVVFMFLAYGVVFGGASIVALTINVLMIIGFMSVSQSTLTLPGVAGLILTLAVAVDANVLIYERIRDEERAGHPPIMAIETGFKRAWVSIFDANVTSLISAFIMMSFGSGPVKGFATMLTVGVITSVLTAMLVTQVLLGMWFRAVRPKALPI